MEPVLGPAKPDPGDHYCYLPLYVFCGRHLLAAKLRPANIDRSAGSIEEHLVSKKLPGIRLVSVELEVGGKAPRKARRRFTNSSRPGLRDTPNSRSSATWISMSSLSFSSSASTTEAGRRTARLLPHFATCMEFAMDIRVK
jgi:hypothetical protein